MEYASTIDIGARKAQQDRINEDSIATAVFENHHRQSQRSVGVFVLCDGVGGEASGDVASFVATTVIRKRLTDALLGPATDTPAEFEIDASQEPPPTVADPGDETAHASPGSMRSEEDLRAAIEAAITAAHRRIQEYAAEIDGRPATTAVVGVYIDGRLHYGWVGDSRAYLINSKHGAIQQLTKDHAVTNRLLAEGDIDDEVYARIHEETTAITNALGGSAYGDPDVDVDFDSVPLFRDDILLLTSDGLIDAFPHIAPLRTKYEQATDKASVRKEILDCLVTDDEIRDIVLEADDLRAGIDDLVAFANDRGGKDNLSVALARDPAADPSPETLPTRGVASESVASLTAQETTVEPSSERDDANADPEPRPEDADQPADGSHLPRDGGRGATDAAAGDLSPDVDLSPTADTPSPPDDHQSPADGEGARVGEPPEDAPDEGSESDATAVLVIPGHDNVYELEDGFTIGRGEVEGSDNPNIGLVVDDTADIETHHARFEHDAGDWRVRDISTSGTFVEGEDGDWRYLLSDAGIKQSREQGCDPDASDDGAPPDEYRLRNGTAITLHHPHDRQSVPLRFFASADRATRRPPGGGDDDAAGH